ncbi:GPW/gp25 family protein [Streptomyces sp. NPDC058326]|uniref:GPW/gp25 family protein n=1 Tax=Streptomyces sp. NPDC058326 TaxID=3346447 RepID=UPI0036F18D00
MNGLPHLGAGWSFPVRWYEPVAESGSPSAGGVRVRTATGEDTVAQAVELVVRTAVGERVMRPDFGSTAHHHVFAASDAASCHRLAHELRTALLRCEPRAVVERLEAVADREADGRVVVTVEYRTDPHRRPTNLVLPFHLEGGA